MENQLEKLKVSTFAQLSKKKLAEVKRFVARCKRADGYQPIFYWGCIEHRKNQSINELLCYTETNDLVSYLSFYHFEENEVEITLMVDPKYRQVPFYEALFAQVKRIISEYPVTITRYVFTCNQQCLTLKEYLNGLGAQVFQFTHKLALTPKNFAMRLPIEKTLNLDRMPLEFRKATPSDMLALIRLEVDCFQISREVYQEQLCQAFQDIGKGIMVAVKNQEIIGKIHLQFEKKSVYLYSLCVATHEQGQGYGALLLEGVIKFLFNRGIKSVLVNVENDTHLSWYKKFYFKRVAIYEHWRLPACQKSTKEYEKHLENLLLNFQCYQLQDQLSRPVYKH